jgi:hypothetical protein
MSTNIQRASRVEKQLRRIECRRRERAAAAIAAMPLSQQMTLACDLWRAAQQLKAVARA